MPWLSVLTYHRFPDPSGHEPFDDAVADVTTEDFDRQLRCLKRHFAIVGVNELCAFAQGKPLPRNAVAITFDDGYLDGHARALPLLKRHDAKAIFFVPTAYIGERRLFWWDRVAYLIKRSIRATLELEYPSRLRISLTCDRRLAVNQVLRLVKTHRALDLERFLHQIATAAGVAWSHELERSFAQRLLMTWDHVRDLRKAGMDVQSHTRTHRVLQTLAPAELLDELAGSRADLQRELGEPVRALAYPVGNPVPRSSPIRAALETAGYEIGFSNGTGPNPFGRCVDRFNICRHTMGMNCSEAHLLTILAIPPLAPKHPWQLSPP